MDSATGALVIGLPLRGVHAWISDDEGKPLALRQVGEIVIDTATNMTAYWNKPDASAEILREGGLRTGDVGFMEEKGWFYLVDRKKDMIVAAGFKVWPREVEDVLYMHPDVVEAAVIGVPDPYRGETVKAYVIPRSMKLEPRELIEHCRKNLAAYKVPKQVELVAHLEKTSSGTPHER